MSSQNGKKQHNIGKMIYSAGFCFIKIISFCFVLLIFLHIFLYSSVHISPYLKVTCHQAVKLLIKDHKTTKTSNNDKMFHCDEKGLYGVQCMSHLEVHKLRAWTFIAVKRQVTDSVRKKNMPLQNSFRFNSALGKWTETIVNIVSVVKLRRKKGSR